MVVASMKRLFANTLPTPGAAGALHEAIDHAVALANAANEIGGSPEEIRQAFLLGSVTLAKVVGFAREAYLGLVEAFWEIVEIDFANPAEQAAPASRRPEPPDGSPELSLAIFEGARQAGGSDIEIAMTLAAGVVLVSKTLASSLESLEHEACRHWTVWPTESGTAPPFRGLGN